MQNNCTTSDRSNGLFFSVAGYCLQQTLQKSILNANMRHCTVMKRSLDEQLFCIRQYLCHILTKNGLYAGMGAFGNSAAWVNGAVDKALRKYASTPLDVYMVTYG
jgi:hypothetical protein